MNHSSKISLVLLLLPIYNHCSEAESKTNKGVVFVPGKKTGESVPAASAALVPAANGAPSASSTSGDTTAVAAVGAVLSVVLGDAYKFRPIVAQTTDYGVGKDGIAKFTKWENSSAYVNRLIQNGKFASAAKHQQDSFLSDHIRRDLDARKEALLATSKDHCASVVDLTQKQRTANNQLFGALAGLLQAVKEHTPREITPGAIDLCIQTAQASVDENNKLLETFSKEIQARKKFLEDVMEQLRAIKTDQQAQGK